MKRIIIISALLAAAAMAPPAALAHEQGDGVLRITLKLPVNFANPTPACPQGIATYRLAARETFGHGANCLGNSIPLTCPTGSTAFLCQIVPAHIKLRLPGGTIRSWRGRIHETWTCVDAACATISIFQQWQGHISSATRRFDDLTGGSMTGGGTAVVDAATFAFKSFHEELLIREDD